MKNSQFIYTATLIAVFIFLNTLNTYAQFTPPDTPCDPEDSSCPLDTWIIVFACLALFTTTLYLLSKQKLLYKRGKN